MRIALFSSVMSLALLGGCASLSGQMHGMHHPNAGATTENAAIMANCPMMNTQASAHGGAQSGAASGDSTPHEHNAGADGAAPARAAADASTHPRTPPPPGAAMMNCPIARERQGDDAH